MKSTRQGSDKKRWSEKSATEKASFVIVVSVIAIIAVGVVISLFSSQNSDGSLNNESATVTKEVAEEACQEVAVIKTQNRNISVIDVWNYNATFTEDAGDGLSSLQWSGKDGNTDGRVLFVCDVRDVDGSLEVVSLVMNGERLQ